MCSCGNCTDFFRIYGGALFQYGHGTAAGYRPFGARYEYGGRYLLVGAERTQTASFRVAGNAIPEVPATSNYNKTFSYSSMATYQYAWSNWKTGECKQGAWDNGQRGGHMFFDIASIRSFLSGTVQDGSTITLTRRNAGGYSTGTNVYVCGSNCSSASGTPSYSNKTLLGTLSWGQTATFTLPKAIVNSLTSGACNIRAFYSGTGHRIAYLQLTACILNLQFNP